MTEPIYANQLLDHLVLADLDAICDRTGLTMADLAALAAGHAAPDDLRACHPAIDLAHWDRAASYALGDPHRADPGAELPRRTPGAALDEAMHTWPGPGFEDGCE